MAEMNNNWVVNVPVATIWTLPSSPRPLDKKAITNPVDIQDWIEGQSYGELLELHQANLVQTQVLFGEKVQVLEEKAEWLKVLVPSQPTSKDERGYPGWIPKGQLVQIEDWEVKNGAIAVVRSNKATLYDVEERCVTLLSYQTRLPLLRHEGEWVKVRTPIGLGLLKKVDVALVTPQSEQTKRTGRDIVIEGEKFLHLPYLWGGMSSFGYDCSGFTYNMCKANGYIIPRDAVDQSQDGVPVKLSELEPGDLLFFAYEEGKGKIHHVGIYYGDGKMLHSPKTGKVIEIIELKDTFYEKELCAARRYW